MGQQRKLNKYIILKQMARPFQGHLMPLKPNSRRVLIKKSAFSPEDWEIFETRKYIVIYFKFHNP